MFNDFNNISDQESSLFNKDGQKKSDAIAHKVKYFGSGDYQLSKKDIGYIVYGACFLGSGGGASIGLSLLCMDQMIGDDNIMYYVNPDDLEANKNISFVALLGSPDKMFEGFGQTAALNAFLEMDKYLIESGQNSLGYLIPVELGAINTLIPFIISAKNGIAVINGDPCGRAAPEMSMNLFNINKLSLNPVILTSDSDDSGNYQKIVTREENADGAENHARQFAKTHNNVAGMACYPMKGSDLNCLTAEKNQAKFIQWTIGLAWNLGRYMIEFGNYKDFLNFMNSFIPDSYRLFEGIIVDKEERKISGFDAGKVTVSNGDGRIFIYYKNESLLAWNVTKKCYMAMGPDSINFLAKKDAQPFSNADINSDPEKNIKNIPLGTEIGVFGLCAFKKLNNTLLVDLFLRNIQEVLAAFPEDQVIVPNSYIPLQDLILHYN